MEKAMLPMNFVLLDDLHWRKLHPDEAISLYIHNLRKLLSRALPDAAQATKEPLLQQYMVGIPKDIARQLRASGEVNMLEKAMTCARLLMMIDLDPVAAVADKNQGSPEENPNFWENE